MDLSTVSVAGFRRFKGRSSLQTNGKLVAVLGPNEAGKSSILRAIELLGSDDAPEARDFCRATEKSAFEITGRFYLDSDDLDAAGLTGPYWLSVVKTADGVRRYRLEPPPPQRDRTPRDVLRSAITALFSHKRFIAAAAANERAEEFSLWRDEVEKFLGGEEEDLTEEQILSITAHVREFISCADDRMASLIRSIPEHLSAFESHEKAPNPRKRAISVLAKRVPAIVVFDEEARNLLPEYDMAQLLAGVPLALDNLFDLSGVKSDDYIRVVSEGDQAKIATIERKVNIGLEKNFAVYWQQSKIKVSVKGLVDRVIVHVINENEEFTSFAERSDGLRQFVALIAFASGIWTGKPIMVIDEAEQKLHYDAQADLVQMLGRQQVASKIIYTTHSAGCLPEDLGNGVHLVHPDKADEIHSKINNKFWDENIPGFAPLLFGMGASTMAFFPTRHAVMVEGPSDMLLLPTMMRYALGVDVLGFQFVPGLSYTEGFVQSPALGKPNGVLYLVDGDPGGEKIKVKLLELKIPKKDVFVLASPDGAAVEVEDFLRADILISALNEILKKHHKSDGLVAVRDLPAKGRMDWVEKYYKDRFEKKISKIALSYEVLDLINGNPNRNPIEPKRIATFKAIAQKIHDRFISTKKEAALV